MCRHYHPFCIVWQWWNSLSRKQPKVQTVCVSLYRILIKFKYVMCVCECCKYPMAWHSMDVWNGFLCIGSTKFSCKFNNLCVSLNYLKSYWHYQFYENTKLSLLVWKQRRKILCMHHMSINEVFLEKVTLATFQTYNNRLTHTVGRYTYSDNFPQFWAMPDCVFHL